MMGALTSQDEAITNLLTRAGIETACLTIQQRDLSGCRSNAYRFSFEEDKTYTASQDCKHAESNGWSVLSIMTMRTHLFVLATKDDGILIRGVA
jgi:hypothetical protein